jgi:cytochrome c-type biogenesis protein CcmH/NrfF
MPKWKISVLAAVLIAACLAQNATQMESAEVNRVASRLACTCGCNLKMDCKMEPWPCHVCKGFKAKIIEMQAAGKSDDQILDQFVQENGKSILAVGPGPLGVIGPYAALALGALLVIFVIRRYVSRRPQTAPVDTAVLDQYHDRIEKDLAKLD